MRTAIPAYQASDEGLNRVLEAMKLNLDGITGQTTNSDKLVALGKEATPLQLVNLVNLLAKRIGLDGVNAIQELTNFLSGVVGTTKNQNDNSTSLATTAYVNAAYIPVRQTVISGPVDSAGLPAFGGSTGSATLTASGTLVATSSNGSSGDRRGSITNPAFTSPAGSGTAYLYLDINADGTCTAGVSASLQPVYQEGGTYSTANGQFTFNISEMTGKVGNGSVATQTYRVYIGQCAHTAGVWSGTIVWYALRGRYDSGWTATLPSAAAQVSKNHNLGVTPDVVDMIIECTASELIYNAGDQTSITAVHTSDGAETRPLPIVKSRLAALLQVGSTVAFLTLNSSGGGVSMTLARYKYKFVAKRGW